MTLYVIVKAFKEWLLKRQLNYNKKLLTNTQNMGF